MEKRKNKTFVERCEQVLQFIQNYYFKNHYMPSYDDISEGTGIKSKGGHISHIIDQLIENGDLERIPGIARGLRLPHNDIFSVPLKGIIAADSLNPEVVLDNDPTETFEILSEFIPHELERSKVYALKVRGDSMQGIFIADGDTVLMRAGDEWQEGDIVAVWLEKESAVTLKRIYNGRPGVIKLKPESHRHHTRVENQGDIKVMGRLVGVIRKYS